MQWTLALNATLGLATAILYFVVGRVVGGRAAATEEAERARDSFARWWNALALISALGATVQLAAAANVTPLWVHAASAALLIPILMVALACLLQYLVYIYSGTTRWNTPILLAHLAVGVSYMIVIGWRRPTGVEVDDWTAHMTYAREAPAWFTPYALLTILAPVIVASLAYLALAFRTRHAVVRFRILTVSLAFLFWFGSGGVAAIAGWSDWYWWPLVSRAIGLVSTLMILFAYRPPRGLEERLERRDEEAALRTTGDVRRWRLAITRWARPSRSPTA